MFLISGISTLKKFLKQDRSFASEINTVCHIGLRHDQGRNV